MARPVYAQVVSITVNEMNIEQHPTCNWDSVTLYDGSSSNSPLLAKMCTIASVPGSPIKSTGSSLFVHFTSDVSVHTGRFSLNWTFVSRGWFMSFIKHSIIPNFLQYNNSHYGATGGVLDIKQSAIIV